jgi:S1-C subfamily serine protease
MFPRTHPFYLSLLLLLVGLTAGGCKHTPAPTAAHSSPAKTAAPTPPPAAEVAPLPPGARTEDEKNTIAVFGRAAPSAVFVSQHKTVFDYFHGQALDVPAGSGSGFVWDDQGHVVTNFHVVQGAKRLTVTLEDQHTYDASIVGVEPRKDIAVLHIDAPHEKLHPILHGKEPPQLVVGQKVIAIGNPFGLDHTLTTGIVSALGRGVQGVGGVTIHDMIQTDAAINPGNSGGPLLDSAGELIGMNTMIFSKSGAWAGIGFAVPARFILRIVPQIIKTGRAQQVGLGIQIDPLGRLERRLGLRGVVVLDVVPGSPADKAGLQGIRRTAGGFEIGDVIVGIDGKPITDYDQLYNTLDGRKPGEQVKVRVARANKVRVVEMSLVIVQ